MKIESWDDFAQVVINQAKLIELKKKFISMEYVPSSITRNPDAWGGQLEFHRSIHPVRFLCPGNGFGKSSAMGHEWNAWATHSNRWQITPMKSISGIWFCPGYAQWDKIRKEVLEPYCFDKVGWRYLKSEYTYVWPDGSALQARSHEYDWTVEQGTNPDIVFFDELFPQELWTEMQMRRRGKTKTRFVVSATQTQGMSWMHDALYAPWLEHHKQKGLGEEDATRQQLHPDFFVWPLGGIRSNPAMSAEDFRWYESSIVYSSEQEKKVRLAGGFGDWSGAAVFDLAAVRWMRDRARQFKEVVSKDASIVPYLEAA